MTDPDPVVKVTTSSGGIGIMMVVAILGGMARQAHQVLSGKKVSWFHFFMRAIISTFIGMVCYYALPPATPWTFAVTGLCAWLGADSVPLLFQIFFHKKDEK